VAQQENEPVDSGLVEKQVVALAEVRILVTDRKGQPIIDLKPDEIRLYEGDVEQRIAFLETASGARERLSGDPAPGSPLSIDATNLEDVPQETLIVLPPRAIRRVVMAFDVSNSRKAIREQWRESALSWLSTGMLPEDRVGIVLLGSHPEWLVDLTGDTDLLRSALRDFPLKKSAVGRDRSREMSMLMSDIRECFEVGAAGTTARGGGVPCAYDTARPRVHRWNAEAEGTVRNLRSLVGQLAAVPGRKAVLLFSDGFIGDPSMMAVHAIVANLGSADYNLDMEKMKTRFGKDIHHEVARLHQLARVGDVTFFTLNTKQGGDTGFSGDLEHDRALPATALGVDPWKDMGTSLEHTLSLMARETGGRSYDGVRELTANLQAAADSFFGMYTVGYYRADPNSPEARVQVRVDRDHVTVTFPERGSSREPVVAETRLELVIGNPRSTVGGETLTLPLAARIAFDSLPLREVGRSAGTVLGLYFRAVQPDGTVVAERLDVKTVGVDKNQLEEAAGMDFVHWSELILPPGSFRILVRVSDDRLQLVASRAVDLTLGPDFVRPGLEVHRR